MEEVISAKYEHCILAFTIIPQDTDTVYVNCKCAYMYVAYACMNVNLM